MKPMEVTASRSHGESKGLMEFQSEVDVVVAEGVVCGALLLVPAARAAPWRAALFFLLVADTMEALKKCWKAYNLVGATWRIISMLYRPFDCSSQKSKSFSLRCQD